MNFVIPMFLGFRTTTDSYELSQYIKEARLSNGKRFAAMNEEFDAKFPGIRRAVVAAQRGLLEITGKTPTYQEHREGSVRALNETGMSVWHKIETKDQ